MRTGCKWPASSVYKYYLVNKRWMIRNEMKPWTIDYVTKKNERSQSHLGGKYNTWRNACLARKKEIPVSKFARYCVLTSNHFAILGGDLISILNGYKPVLQMHNKRAWRALCPWQAEHSAQITKGSAEWRSVMRWEAMRSVPVLSTALELSAASARLLAGPGLFLLELKYTGHHGTLHLSRFSLTQAQDNSQTPARPNWLEIPQYPL